MDFVVLAGLQGSGPTHSRGARGSPLRRDALAAARIGCAILALLLASLGDSRAARADQPAEKRASSVSVNPPSDAAIQRRIEGILAASGGVEHLEVEVRSGVVHLGGRAANLALREQAGDLAARVEGVVVVRNDVQVASDVRGRLTPTLAKVKGYLAGALGFLPVLAVAFAALVAFAILASLVGRSGRLFRRLGLSQLGANVLRVALRAMLLVTGVVVTLDILGLLTFVGKVVGALGILGVIVGIAFKDVITNHLPGIILGLHPPFAPGDNVQIGQHEGRVVRVTTRETILVADDGQQLRLPNVRVLQEPIVNLDRHRERRLHFPIDVALSANLRQVRDVGRETLRSMPGILREPRPFMRVLRIGADQVHVEFYAWADQRKVTFLELASGAKQAVKEALLAAGVPFPVQKIAVHRPPSEMTASSLEEEEQDGPEQALLDAHVREEQAEPGERDLLREGRSRPTKREWGESWKPR